MENNILTEDIIIRVSGKDKNELKKKIKKYYFLISFIKNNTTNKFLQGIFIFFITLFLLYIFFGIYISGFGIYSNKYIGKINKEILYFNISKKPYTIEKVKINTCGKLYCIDINGNSIPKPLIESYIIY